MNLTKDDLKEFRNIFIEELDSRFATMENNMEKRIDLKFSHAIKSVMEFFVTKDEFNDLKAQVALLPTKEEFFNKMDGVVTELEEHRVERVSLGFKVTRLEKKVSKIE